METDEKIMRAWDGFRKKMNEKEAIVGFYRLAEDAGRQDGISALEKELLSDTVVEATLQTFGWGMRSRTSVRYRTSVITQRALLREAVRLAMEKMESKTAKPGRM